MVDRVFEPLNRGVADVDLLHARRNPRRRIGQPRTEREQVLLQQLNQRRDLFVHARRAGRAQARVQLVDFAVRINPRVRLGYAGVVEQRRLLPSRRSSYRSSCSDSRSTLAGDTPHRMPL
jgi:hypothetical protein